MKAYQKTILPNGIIVQTEKMPQLNSASVGAWIPRGSRHEKKEEFGLSHFYEHLVFKGTKNRTTFEIASSLEDRGGSLEAYTTRQETGFYANVVFEDIELALDVISDMLMNPLFKKTEMEKERRVVIEEIHSYDDMTEEVVGDLFNAIHFKGSGLAHSITGTISQVKKLTHKQMLEYERQIIEDLPIYICAVGNIHHEKIVEICKKKFAKKKSGLKIPQDLYVSHEGVKILTKSEISQCNLFWGTSFNENLLKSRNRSAFSLYNVAIGSGMTSRLFQKIREKYGLAYSVYSTIDVFKDCIDWGVSIATEAKNAQRAIDISIKEVEQFLKKGFAKNELERTKKNILGAMRLSLDSPEKRVLRLAEQTLHFGNFLTLQDVENELNSLREDEILEILRNLFSSAKYTLTVAQPKNTKKLDLEQIYLNF